MALHQRAGHVDDLLGVDPGQRGLPVCLRGFVIGRIGALVSRAAPLGVQQTAACLQTAGPAAAGSGVVGDVSALPCSPSTSRSLHQQFSSLLGGLIHPLGSRKRSMKAAGCDGRKKDPQPL